MTKLLVDNPFGIQEVIEVGEGGGYFDSSLVLWDERIDGTIPEITLGAMKRQGKKLILDLDKKSRHDQKVEEKSQAESDRESKRQARLAIIKDKSATDKARLKALIEHFGLDL